MASNLWLSYAFLAASVYATLSLLDKIILDKETADPFKTTALNILPKFALFVVVGVVTGNTALESGITSTNLVPILFGGSIGFVNFYSRLIYYKGVEETDISRFIPLRNTDVVFVLLMGALLLGESFTLPVYVGVFIIFLGTMLISIDDLSQGVKLISRDALVFGLLSAFTLALISVQMKFLTPVMTLYAILFWFGVGGICSVGIHAVFEAMRGTLGGNEETELNVFSSAGFSLLLSGVGGGVGYFPLIWALGSGPVSIVTAIVNLQVLLVFFGVVVLTRFTPEVLQESMDRLIFAQKLTASVLMMAGVVVIQVAS